MLLYGENRILNHTLNVPLSFIVIQIHMEISSGSIIFVFSKYKCECVCVCVLLRQRINNNEYEYWHILNAILCNTNLKKNPTLMI